MRESSEGGKVEEPNGGEVGKKRVGGGGVGWGVQEKDRQGHLGDEFRYYD